MAKFSGSAAPATNLHGAVTTTDDRVLTHEGGLGFARDAKSDLFVLAITNMVGEDTFYEGADARDARFRQLIAQVVAEDPGWVARFVPYLRNEMRMRSASAVMACEYVRAGGPHGRAVIASACARPDEPAEILGYWLSEYGRKVPMPVKRGLADAARRLYTERAVLRYDGQTRTVRMADVLELAHPRPEGAGQEALFKFLLDRRHHGDAVADPETLPLLATAAKLEAIPEDQRRAGLRESAAEGLAKAGFSWERLSGWLPGGMDAEAWEAIIPSMGVMALVRNLRNFDQAGISEAAVDAVIAKITDPAEVERARLFPYQVWAAYRETSSDNWQRALGRTLDLVAPNVPALDRTLVLIDTSASMNDMVSGRSKMSRVEVAAVMAMTTWKRSTDVDVVLFGESHMRLQLPPTVSTLTGVEQIKGMIGMVGHATYGHTAIAAHFDPARHRRVVMFTDDQQHDAGQVRIDHVPTIFTFNLGGYAPSSLKAGEKGRYTMGGFSDATFQAISLLERGKDAGWPF